jgi:hypothetical protein
VKISISSLQTKERIEQKEKDLVWANSIKERDKWSCVICGSEFHPNAHHIIPRENKDFRHELNNGVTLCTNHHKFSRLISAHNNPLAFFLWLEKYHPEAYYNARNNMRTILSSEFPDL